MNNDLHTPTASLLTNGGRWNYRTVPSGYKTQQKLVFGGGRGLECNTNVKCPDMHHLFEVMHSYM